jgi:biopolymer transport protein ExbD
LCVLGLWVATAIENPGSVGFHVRLHSPIVQKQGFDRWLQPIVVRVDTEARYYLDGTAIPARRIPVTLAGFLQTRANRTVYVEGDLDSNFGGIGEAADAVRHAGGQVVLLTPTRP